jgi:exopolysaccharide production protein ExoY
MLVSTVLAQFGSIGRAQTRQIAPAAKRIIDVAIAVAVTVACLPAFAAVYFCLLLDGKDILFRHPRVGRNGRIFLCLKFRTMRPDADAVLQRTLAANPAASAEWRSTRKLKNDPRVTPLGRFLRATSLDELPQLFNVIRGDMSLVGPRPIVSTELEEFYRPLGGASAYLSVRPGMTGPWQISGRSCSSYEARVALDIAYARSHSIIGDLAILLRTVPAVLRREGAF